MPAWGRHLHGETHLLQSRVLDVTVATRRQGFKLLSESALPTGIVAGGIYVLTLYMPTTGEVINVLPELKELAVIVRGLTTPG
eukprot:5370173-Amphidinium_carterae.2